MTPSYIVIGYKSNKNVFYLLQKHEKKCFIT